MQELVKTQVDFENLGNDDPQIAYLIGAWTRICKILGKDFEQYLPIVMGPVLKAAAFKPEVTVLAGASSLSAQLSSREFLSSSAFRRRHRCRRRRKLGSVERGRSSKSEGTLNSYSFDPFPRPSESKPPDSKRRPVPVRCWSAMLGN